MQSSSTISIEHLQAKAQAADDAAKQEFRKKAESYAYDFRFALKEASRLLGVSAGFLRKYAAAHKIAFPDPDLRTKEEHKAIFRQYEEIRLAKEPKRVEPRKPAIQPGSLKLSPQLDKLSKQTLWDRHNKFLERVQELAESMTMKEVSKVVNVSLRFLKNLAYEHDIEFITSQSRARKSVASAVTQVVDVVAVAESVAALQAESVKVVAEAVQAKVDVQPAAAVPAVAGRVIGTLPAPPALSKQKPRGEQSSRSSAAKVITESLERVETTVAQVGPVLGAAQSAEAQLMLPLKVDAPDLVMCDIRQADEPSCPTTLFAISREAPGSPANFPGDAPGVGPLRSGLNEGLLPSALVSHHLDDQANFASIDRIQEQPEINSVGTVIRREDRLRVSERRGFNNGWGSGLSLARGRQVSPPSKRRREVRAIGGLSPPTGLYG